MANTRQQGSSAGNCTDLCHENCLNQAVEKSNGSFLVICVLLTIWDLMALWYNGLGTLLCSQKPLSLAQ